MERRTTRSAGQTQAKATMERRTTRSAGQTQAKDRHTKTTRTTKRTASSSLKQDAREKLVKRAREMDDKDLTGEEGQEETKGDGTLNLTSDNESDDAHETDSDDVDRALREFFSEVEFDPDDVRQVETNDDDVILIANTEFTSNAAVDNDVDKVGNCRDSPLTADGTRPEIAAETNDTMKSVMEAYQANLASATMKDPPVDAKQELFPTYGDHSGQASVMVNCAFVPHSKKVLSNGGACYVGMQHKYEPVNIGGEEYYEATELCYGKVLIRSTEPAVRKMFDDSFQTGQPLLLRGDASIKTDDPKFPPFPGTGPAKPGETRNAMSLNRGFSVRALDKTLLVDPGLVVGGKFGMGYKITTILKVVTRPDPATIIGTNAPVLVYAGKTPCVVVARDLEMFAQLETGKKYLVSGLDPRERYVEVSAENGKPPRDPSNNLILWPNREGYWGMKSSIRAL